MHLKLLSVKCWPFCLGLSVLNKSLNPIHHSGKYMQKAHQQTSLAILNHFGKRIQFHLPEDGHQSHWYMETSWASIRHHADAKVFDRCLINVNLSVYCFELLHYFHIHIIVEIIMESALLQIHFLSSLVAHSCWYIINDNKSEIIISALLPLQMFISKLTFQKMNIP